MANPIPALKFAAIDSTGAPLSGGKLYTYDAGTTTPRTTYTDSTLGTPNANPVILDSRGEANVWLSGGYKFVLKDSSDVTIYTVDNITDALTNTTMSGTLTISSTAVTWSGNPTHSGNHTFSGNVTVQGNTTLGNAGTDTVTTNGNVAMNAPTTGVLLSGTGLAATQTFSFTSGGPGNSGLRFGYNVGISSNQENLWVDGTNGFTIGTSGNAGYSIATNSTQRLVVLGDGRLYGTALHNNAVAVTGTTNQYIASGTYTPTITAVTNVGGSPTGRVSQWTRVGNVVTVSGSGNWGPTSASAQTQVGISLPIASNFANTYECSGTAVRQKSTTASVPGYINGDTTNDRAQLSYFCDTDNSANDFSWTFSYVVL